MRDTLSITDSITWKSTNSALARLDTVVKNVDNKWFEGNSWRSFGAWFGIGSTVIGLFL
jgi:hypothetical protein